MHGLEESGLRQGLIALVITLLEVNKAALARAAIHQLEGGPLSDAEAERLVGALAELESAVAELKVEHGVERAVQSIRDDLDDLVGRVISALADPAATDSQESRKAEASVAPCVPPLS